MLLQLGSTQLELRVGNLLGKCLLNAFEVQSSFESRFLVEFELAGLGIRLPCLYLAEVDRHQRRGVVQFFLSVVHMHKSVFGLNHPAIGPTAEHPWVSLERVFRGN